MAENPNPNAESLAVQTHVTIMQGVIQRMAGNTSSCKLQCILSVATVLIGVLQTKNPLHSLFAIIPLIIFLILDTYYLSLEQGFRRSYNEFVKTLHNGELCASDLYDVKLTGSVWNHAKRSVWSFSIWPFYITLFVMVTVVWLVRTHY